MEGAGISLKRIYDRHYIIAILRDLLVAQSFDLTKGQEILRFFLGYCHQGGVVTDHKLREVDFAGSVLAPEPEGGIDASFGFGEVFFRDGWLFFSFLFMGSVEILIKDEDGPEVRIAGYKLCGGFLYRHRVHKGVDGLLVSLGAFRRKPRVKKSEIHCLKRVKVKK